MCAMEVENGREHQVVADCRCGHIDIEIYDISHIPEKSHWLQSAHIAT